MSMSKPAQVSSSSSSSSTSTIKNVGNKKSVLLLLDLNGTIAYRSEQPVRGVEPLLSLRQKHYYPRHGIKEFIRTLSKAGFAVAIYTSIMRHNILPFVHALMSTELQDLHKIYDRDYNKPDPNAVNSWDTVRDMEKIWRSEAFGPCNTILVDNEPRKFQDFPKNGIVVPEYGEEEVRGRSSHTLDTLQKYLLRMSQQAEFTTAEFDVREYMQKAPFDPNVSMDELTAQLTKLDIKKQEEEKEEEKKQKFVTFFKVFGGERAAVWRQGCINLGGGWNLHTLFCVWRA